MRGIELPVKSLCVGHVSGLFLIISAISVEASGFSLKKVDLYFLKCFPSLLNAKNNSGLLPLRIIPFAFPSAAVGLVCYTAVFSVVTQRSSPLTGSVA